MHAPTALSAIAAASVAVSGAVHVQPPMHRRQVYAGVPGVDGMGAQYRSPFSAFMNQGLVPGQGFPQVGMSAYGYGLPGLGLDQFLSPDAQILAGVGEGAISGHDLNNIDNRVNGYDQFKDTEGARSKPDPAYPGCFKSEDCDGDDKPASSPRHRIHESGTGSAPRGSAMLLWIAAAAAAALML